MGTPVVRTVSGFRRSSPLLSAMRPKQWSKNLLLFAGVIFARQVLLLPQLGRVSLAFLCFCLLSSALYIFNDLIDLEGDRKHPRKRSRAIASGAVSIHAAVAVASLSAVAGLILAFFLGRTFFLTAAAYTVLTASYTLYLKRLVIIDVMAIAAGFVLRAIAGAIVIDVVISSWLLVCTMLLALFLGLTKRRQELQTNGGCESRQVLDSYPVAFLDQAITIITAATVMSYSLYTFTSTHSNRLMWTIPFVIYGIFRYLLLTHLKGTGEEPEEVLLGDAPFLINVALWLLISGLIIYRG